MGNRKLNLRELTPANGISSPIEALIALTVIKDRSDSLSHLFESFYPKHEILFTSCGKESLSLIFQALVSQYGVRALVLGAYNCPDIVTAGLKAGLEIHLMDTDPKTLELIPSTASSMLKHKRIVVVMSNLFGLPDRIARLALDGLKSSGVAEEVFVIDDACQAALSRVQSDRIGGRSEAVCGVLSFGRGKALSAIGGGAIIVSKEENCIKDSLHTFLRDRPKLHWANRELKELKEIFVAQLMWMFQQPYLYSIPSHFPGLGLGSSPVHFSWPRDKLSFVQAIYIAARLRGASKLRREVQKRSKWWADALQGSSIVFPLFERNFNLDGEIIPVRFPIVFHNERGRDRAYQLLSSHGLGASKSYGMALSDFPDLAGRVSHASIEGARTLARTLLTLPVHPGVSENDVLRASQIIRKIL